MSSRRILLLAAAIQIGFLPAALPLVASESLPTAVISRNGEAQLPIFIAVSASRETTEAARELASYLERITGGRFEIQNVADTTKAKGIVIGTDEEFPGFLPAIPEGESPLLRREDYVLRSQKNGSLVLIGRTPLGLQNAVWDCLYRVGFRQFFPSKHWEIWPENANLALAIDEFQRPSFAFRLLTAGVASATWQENAKAFEQWKIRNRMISGFALETGHIYQEITRQNPDHFRQHPSDVAENDKLDPSSPTLLELVTEFSLDYLRRNPAKDSISMDPSDGGGWRKDSPLGSPSNQAVILANHVARAIQAEFPGKKVGIYAYNEHSVPSDIAVDPNVVVSIATSFIKGGYTVEELMKRWSENGATLGIREYLSVYPWDFDLPGRSTASRVITTGDQIRTFYQGGARYWRSEGSNAWGPHGLGYYVVARVLWDVREGERLPELLNDFYNRSFGNAAGEMKTFFEQYLFGERKPLVCTDLVGRMYRTLSEAYGRADNAAVARRIEDFIAYTRFVELMVSYQTAEGKQRRVVYENLAKFAWQIRSLDMVNSYAVFRWLPRIDTRIGTLPKWTLPPSEHPLKIETGIVQDDYLTFIQNGIANNSIAEFEPVRYSNDLVPANLPDSGKEGQSTLQMRGTNQLYLFAGPDQKRFEFTIKGGLIYGKQGPVKLRLFSDHHVFVDKPLVEVEVPADKEEHAIYLETPYPGLHRLEISDGRDLTAVSWPKGQYASFPVSLENGVRFSGPYEMVFFVPKGVKTVSGYSTRPKGSIALGTGKTIFKFTSMQGAGYFSIDVPEGADGTWWTLRGSGEKVLLTVPSYLARNPRELLIPRDASIVE